MSWLLGPTGFHCGGLWLLGLVCPWEVGRLVEMEWQEEPGFACFVQTGHTPSVGGQSVALYQLEIPLVGVVWW